MQSILSSFTPPNDQYHIHMAKGKKTKPPSVRLAENVALLFALDQVQEAAGSNPIPKERLENGLRTLTFDQETEICTALAFLAGVSDDPCDVMAVAVEEHNRPTSIHVKIAINKSKPGDGHETVERVTAGFNGIFKILSRVSKG